MRRSVVQRGGGASAEGIEQYGERFFGLLTEEALKRGSHTSIPQLRDAILAYVDAHDAKPFKRTKTADDILDKVRRFGLRTQRVHAE